MIISVIAFMAAATASAADGSAGASTVAAASSAPPAISAPPAKPKKDPLDRIVCRDVGETGSHLGGGSVCKTQRAWNGLTNDSQKLLQDTTKGGAGYKSSGG